MPFATYLNYKENKIDFKYYLTQKEIDFTLRFIYQTPTSNFDLETTQKIFQKTFINKLN